MTQDTAGGIQRLEDTQVTCEAGRGSCGRATGGCAEELMS